MIVATVLTCANRRSHDRSIDRQFLKHLRIDRSEGGKKEKKERKAESKGRKERQKRKKKRIERKGEKRKRG